MSDTSHHARDIAIGRHAVMAEAFELLADHLGPFIDQRMAEYFCNEPSWAEAAANRLGRPAEHGATDPLFQLLVLRRFWGPVFADFYGQDLRQIVGQLIETRNKWAHFSFPDEPDALQRSVLAIERLLAPVEPGVTGRLRRLRSQVYDPNRDLLELDDPVDGEVDGPATDTANDGAGTGDTGAAKTAMADDRTRPETKVERGPDRRSKQHQVRRRDDVNVSALKAQLAETELVFKELQYRYGDLQDELTNTRRITASKQLRLSAMERQLVEAADHSTSIEEDLIEERITRQHIEWLIVALLATLLLFMVLAST